MGKAAAREPDEIHKQRQPFSVMPSGEINIDRARRGISEHIRPSVLARADDLVE